MLVLKAWKGHRTQLRFCCMRGHRWRCSISCNRRPRIEGDHGERLKGRVRIPKESPVAMETPIVWRCHYLWWPPRTVAAVEGKSLSLGDKLWVLQVAELEKGSCQLFGASRVLNGSIKHWIFYTVDYFYICYYCNCAPMFPSWSEKVYNSVFLILQK